jgi:hypothetical protein
MASGGAGCVRALQKCISSGRDSVGSRGTCYLRCHVFVPDSFDDLAHVRLLGGGIISFELLAVTLEIAVRVRCSCFGRGSGEACGGFGSASCVLCNGVGEGEVTRNRPLARLRNVARGDYFQGGSSLDYLGFGCVGGKRVGSGSNCHGYRIDRHYTSRSVQILDEIALHTRSIGWARVSRVVGEASWQMSI